MTRGFLMGVLAAMSTFSVAFAEDALQRKNMPPEWVMKPPQISGRVCAVGASDPTYFVEDAMTYAAENARKELARVISLDVNSIVIDYSTEKNEAATEAGGVNATAWATKAVVEKSEIMDYWYDEKGTASRNRKGITYALACMPR